VLTTPKLGPFEGREEGIKKINRDVRGKKQAAHLSLGDDGGSNRGYGFIPKIQEIRGEGPLLSSGKEAGIGKHKANKCNNQKKRSAVPWGTYNPGC